jgi:hypothetical protein
MKQRIWVATFVLVAVIPVSAHAGMSAEELAKLAQNPVGNLISLPFQNNTNLNYGPLRKNQNILNIQPVYPIEVSPEWNIITRTIVPVVSQPALFAGDSRVNGIGPTDFSACLSPADPKGGVIWGVGPIVQIPTTSDSALGSYRWGVGPTFVILHLAGEHADQRVLQRDQARLRGELADPRASSADVPEVGKDAKGVACI